MLAGGGIDAHDPQRAKLALALAAVTVGVLARADHRLLGDFERAAAGAVVAFGLLEYLLAPRPGSDAAFGSWHGDFS